jgi:hypothetical protein
MDRVAWTPLTDNAVGVELESAPAGHRHAIGRRASRHGSGRPRRVCVENARCVAVECVTTGNRPTYVTRTSESGTAD